MSDEGLTVDAGAVFSALENDGDRDLLTRIALRTEGAEAGPEAPEVLEDCLLVLRKERWIREGKALQREIEHAADPAALDALLRRKQELARRIDALS